jgi:hypothetical protein
MGMAAAVVATMLLAEQNVAFGFGLELYCSSWSLQRAPDPQQQLDAVHVAAVAVFCFWA